MRNNAGILRQCFVCVCVCVYMHVYIYMCVCVCVCVYVAPRDTGATIEKIIKGQ